MKIRPATSADLPAMNDVTMASKASWGYSAAQLEIWRENLTTSADSLAWPTLVAEAQGRIVAMAQADPTRRPWMLVACWVAPAFMHRGIGAALLREIGSMARDAGHDELHIDADPNAEAFYLRQGAIRFGAIPAAIEGEPDRVRPQLRLSLGAAR